MRVLVILVLLITSSTGVLAANYTAKIRNIQAVETGNPYNTVWLDMDITDSPCSSTNQFDRFTIRSEAQFSVVLAAFMADMAIVVTSAGTCVQNIEQINTIQLMKQ